MRRAAAPPVDAYIADWAASSAFFMSFEKIVTALVSSVIISIFREVSIADFAPRLKSSIAVLVDMLPPKSEKTLPQALCAP
jgi:hypothetical protein